MQDLNPNWNAVHIFSEPNPWIDALVFVAPENEEKAAILCSEALSSWFESDTCDCYGDVLLDALMLSDIEFSCRFCILDPITGEPSAEWDAYVAELSATNRLQFLATTCGPIAVAQAA